MPDDTTPHGGEAMHEPPERARIPQPALPDDSKPMTADIEDEDADPVVESGPGVAEDTGTPSVTRQPGG